MFLQLLGMALMSLWLTGCMGAGQLAGASLLQAGTAAGVGLVGNAVMQPLMQPLMPKQQMPVQQAVTRNCKEMPDGTEECTKTYTTISIVPQPAANSPPASRSSPPGYGDASVSVEKDPCTDWANRAFYKGCWGKK